MAAPPITTLLGGLDTPRFMRRHWQRQPLLVRQAWPGVRAPATRDELFELAARGDVESRLVRREGRRWQVQQGPLPRRDRPGWRTPEWTLLVQGVDLHLAAARDMLEPFRFLPAARLDDLMISWASDGGGVGPHIDAYDVFLLQLQGTRRWRIGPARDRSLRADAPLKILRRFEPEQDWLLEPGDMLYLPPNWAHDGTAVGSCMTASVGFRAPRRASLARELLLRLADTLDDDVAAAGADADADLFIDRGQGPVAHHGLVPARLQAFAQQALRAAIGDARQGACALGEVLSEPKPHVWFRPQGRGSARADWRLALGSRMLYDAQHVYINGESYRAGGRDAALLHGLADTGRLSASQRRDLSGAAQALVRVWHAAGWLVDDVEAAHGSDG